MDKPDLYQEISKAVLKISVKHGAKSHEIAETLLYMVALQMPNTAEGLGALIEEMIRVFHEIQQIKESGDTFKRYYLDSGEEVKK